MVIVTTPPKSFNGGRTVKSIVFLVLAFILVFGGMASSIANHHQKQNASALDVTKYAMCMWGKDSMPAMMYQATQTSDIPFLIRSKSAMNIGTDDVSGGLNAVLDLTGYDRDKINSDVLGRSIGDGSEGSGGGTATDEKGKGKYNSGKKVSFFDRFGVSGMKFSSYTGEWKYVVVDACGDDAKAEPQDPKAGQYYESRLEPVSTWEDIDNSKDVRTKQFARGFGNQYLSSITNTIANWIFTVTKAIVVFVLGLIGITFTDLAQTLGITDLVAGNANGGGGSGGDGLFGTLFKSIFIPLSVTVVFFFGIVMIFYMIRRQHRLGLAGLIRTIAVFLGAFFLAANPALLVSLPNDVAIGVQALTAQSMNRSLVGNDGLCSTNIGGVKDRTKSLTDGAGDAKNDPRSFMESTAKNVQSSMGCMFWQTFLLKPWAQGQFGDDWNKLWAEGSTPGWAKSFGETGEVKNKNKQWVGQPVVPVGGGQELKNWALFQISTQSNAHSPVGHKTQTPKYSNGVANDWWRIVDALSNYDEKGDHKISEDTNVSSESSSSSKWVSPAKGSIVSPFGPRTGVSVDPNKFHHGADIGAKCNDPIVAASEGVVKFVGKEKMGGNMILISHSKDKVDTGYVHMVEGGNVVKVGDHVKAGQLISHVGKTGAAEACHLHFEVRSPGSGNWGDFDSTIDPQKFMKTKGVDLGKDGEGHGGNASEDSSDSGESTQRQAHEPVYNTPDSRWSAWIGNTAWNRMGTAASSVLIAFVGLLPTGIFAVFAAIYALLTPLIVALLPIMMLMALGSQKTFDIFVKYVKTLGYYTMLRIVYGVLMLLSIIFTNVALGYLSTVGWWLGMALLIIFALVLWKLRGMLVGSLSASRAFASQFNNDVSSVAGKFGGAVKSSTNLVAQGTAGGLSAKRNGGSFIRGASSAGKNELRNTFYQSGKNEGFGRAFSISREKFASSTGQDDDYGLNNIRCTACGAALTSGIFGRDSNGNYYCQNCKDDGLTPAGTREVVTDFNAGQQARSDRSAEFAKIQASNRATTDQKLGKNWKRAIETGEEIDPKTGENIQDANGNKKLDDVKAEAHVKELMKGATIDIVKADIRNDKGAHNMNVQIPREIEPFIDRENVAKAWQDGNYDYIEIAYVSAWSQWYHETTGKQMSETMDDLVADIHSYTQRMRQDANRQKIENRYF